MIDNLFLIINFAIDVIAVLLCIVALLIVHVLRYRRSLSEFIKANLKLFVPIAQAVVLLLFVVVFVVLFFVKPEISKNSNGNETVGDVLEDVSTKVNGSMRSLGTVDFTSFDNAKGYLPSEFSLIAETIVSAISNIKSHNYTILAKNTATAAFDVKRKIPSMTTQCDITAINAEDIEKNLDEIKTDIVKVSKVASFAEIMTSTLDGKKQSLLDGIASEKGKITNHLDQIKKFFGTMLTSLQLHKIEIDKHAVVNTKFSEDVDNAITHYWVVLVLPALFASIVIIIQAVFSIKKPTKCQLSNFVVLYVLIFATLVSIVIQLVFFAQQSEDKCETNIPPLFQFYIPTYNHNSGSDGLKPCATENDLLFAGPSNGIFILESNALQAFPKCLDNDIATFKDNNQVDFATKKSNLEYSYSVLKDLYKRNCFTGQDNTTIGEYIEQLDEVRDGLEGFESEVKMLIEDLPNKAHSVITSALEPIKLQSTIDAIDNGIKNSDFNCSRLIVPFNSVFESGCGEETKPVMLYLANITALCLGGIVVLFSLLALLTAASLLPGRVIRDENGDTKSDVERRILEAQIREQRRELEKKDAFASWVKEVLAMPLKVVLEKYNDMARKCQEERKKTENEVMAVWKRYSSRKLNRSPLPVYDNNRVIVKNREIDYINASWVNIPNSSKKYILAEGPLKDTIPQFWAMCWQENVKVIVMLTSFFEIVEPKPDEKNPEKKKPKSMAVEKCSKYFSQALNVPEEFGEFVVTCVEKKEHPDDAVFWRVLKVVNTKAENSTPIFIDHVLAAWWPDQSVPEDPHPVLNLHNWLKTIHKDNSPILVHCSAGIGRTGTFVFIEYAINTISDKKRDTVEILREFRRLRYSALQRPSQLVYAIICILETLVRNGRITRESTREYFEMYKRWRKLQIIEELEKEQKQDAKNE